MRFFKPLAIFSGSSARASLTGFAALCVATGAPGATIFVNVAAPPGGDGAAWATAYKDLRGALTAAVSGDQVWVARGTYRPNTLLDRGVRFDVHSGVEVYGGFAGSESSIEQRPADPDPTSANPAHDTILSGEIGAPGVVDNTVTVVDLSFPSSATRLDRLVISDGANEGGRGGGMRIGNGSPTISDCLFINNTAAEGGALWLVFSSAAVIERCVFKSNTASSAGAIAVQSATPSVRFTRFDSNTATTAGGAVQHAFAGGGAYEHCDFVNCIAGGVGGGAIYTVGQPSPCDVTLTDCTFTNCRAAMAPVAGSGGAIFTNGTGSSIVTRCTFDGCQANQGAAVNDQGGHTTVYSECTFRNGVGGFGGAGLIYIASSFSDCLFENNTASSAGGAVLNNGHASFARCEFRSNTAPAGSANGGAVYLWANGTFTDCLFQSNSSTVGGALYAAGGSHSFDRCRFMGNSATGSGGVIFSSASSTAALHNSLFVGNSSGFWGAVATLNSPGGAPVSFTNCTMTGNTAPQQAINAYSPTIIANCIVRNAGGELGGNTAASFCNIDGGFAGAGNVNADPLFTDAAMGDFSLAAGSPCIDAGNNAAVAPTMMLDLAANARIMDDASTPDTGLGAAPVVDMGAYEFQSAPPPSCPSDANGDEVVDFADITSVLANFNLTGPIGDANHDGSVNFADITSVLSNFGVPCP